MPDLLHSFPSKDLGFLRIVASLWGLELASSEAVGASAELAEALCDAELAEEVISTLPTEGRTALDALLEQGGRMPWVVFTRRFGEVREMGPGKRDREQAHLSPKSAAEILWYRAIVARAFFDTNKGPQEFAYIPDDLLMALDFAGFVASPGSIEAGTLPETAEVEYSDEPAPLEEVEEEIAAETPEEAEIQPEEREEIKVIRPAGKIAEAPTTNSDALGRPASPTEKACPLPASDRLLDDACTLLSALRMGLTPPETRIPARIVREFLLASRLIIPSPAGRGAGGSPTQGGEGVQSEAVKTFLEAPREKALAALVEAWQEAADFNELRLLPGLACEGEWKNEPQETREFLLNLLEPLPDGTWWSIPAFVRDVKAKYPDFQRPAGDYDSWFIKRETDGVFLRGFAHWDEVDGVLIRYFFQMLHWLGQVELASAEENGPATAFRPTQQATPKAEDAKLIVASNGRITIPRLAPRTARYQVARFCEWDAEKDDEYRYRVTPKSLKRAAEQGLKVSHLLGLLAKHTGGQVPPVFVKALQRWEANGTEARVESLTVLKVSKPEVLNELRASKAARFLGEILGPTTVVLQSGAEAKVMAALAEMGLLAEMNQNSEV